jgi:hypothetical protein
MFLVLQKSSKRSDFCISEVWSFCAPRVLNIIFFRQVGNLWASDMMSAGAKHHNLTINKEGA